jgi:hypothetical protein
VSLALAPIRLISVGAFSIWLMLASLAYQQVPALEYAWALNLLQYLPAWAGWLLVLLALLMVTEEARGWAIGFCRGARRLGARLPSLAREGLLLLVTTLVLWLVRDHAIFAQGDRALMLLPTDATGFFGGGGALWLMSKIIHGGVALGFTALDTGQCVNAAFGAIAIVLVARAASLLGSAPAYRAIPLLVFSAGLFRAAAGRIDVQPLLIAAAAACLLFSVQALRSRRHLALTALVFGITASLDPLGRFLLPGLVAIGWLSADAEATRRTRALAAARLLALALVPLVIQAALLLASSPAGADQVLAAVTGRGGAGWLRLSGRVARANTNYLLFSHAHLKYLANALVLLAPAALPLLLGLAVMRRGRIATTPVTRFLSVTCVSLVAGACLIRPIAGPFDWDMASVTALFLAFFAGTLLAEVRADGVRTHLAAAAIGLQIAFFGLPLVAIAFGTPNPSGPFEERAFPSWKPAAAGRAPPALARWL